MSESTTGFIAEGYARRLVPDEQLGGAHREGGQRQGIKRDGHRPTPETRDLTIHRGFVQAAGCKSRPGES